MAKPDGLPPPKQTHELMATMWSDAIKHDLLKWVMFTFPFGRKNTPLENIEGPRTWQRDELNRISENIHNNIELIRKGDIPKIYRSSTASGRGIGKTAFLSWLSLWQMSCQVGASTVIAANTDTQLTNFTFAEVNKWLTMSINKYWFEPFQRMIRPAEWYAKAIEKQLQVGSDYYYILGRLWSEENPVEFAGLHNQRGFMLIYDEASGLPQSIWDVSEGFFTDISPYRFWFAFSNPRKNTGPFYETFHKKREYWYNRQVDSRTVEGADKNHFQAIIDQNGIDSDTARIEVLGLFPSQGDNQFIDRKLVEDACERALDNYDDFAPLVMGVDPARYGDDSTVIRFRRGRDARSYPPVVLKNRDNMFVADTCADLIDKFNPDGVFIDSGAGAGIIDRLKQMGYQVYEVGFGTASGDPSLFDHRTEIWARMKDWLKGAMLPAPDSEANKKLIDDLTAPEYEYLGKESRLKLESKEKMKKRGLSSPDQADAIAVTFSVKLASRDKLTARRSVHKSNRKAKGVGCDVAFE